jgi:hypothetical protein
MMANQPSSSNVVSISGSTKAGAVAAASTASSVSGRIRSGKSGSGPPSGGYDVQIGKLETAVRWIERGMMALSVWRVLRGMVTLS